MCCCAHLVAHLLRRAGARGRRQEHVQAGETLERFVVELARPARALGLGRLEPLAPGELARLAQRLLHALAFALVGEHDDRPASRHRSAPVVGREARAVAPPEAVAVEMQQLVSRLADQLVHAPAEHLCRGGVGERDRPALVHVVDALARELEDAVVVALEPLELRAGEVERRVPLRDVLHDAEPLDHASFLM
jgi:hypothetical protein